jgi:hypothetical protein
VLAGLIHYRCVVVASGDVLLLRREVAQGRVGNHVVAGRQLNRFGEDQAVAVVILRFSRVGVAMLLEVA